MREQLLAAEKITPLEWRDAALYVLDQRVLPHSQVWVCCDSVAAVADAIRQMLVRGAPAIGICAAYGFVLAARARLAAGGDWQSALQEDYQLLAASRPTAVNLRWALNLMQERLQRVRADEDPLAALESEALGIHQSDREANLVMAQLGAEQETNKESIKGHASLKEQLQMLKEMNQQVTQEAKNLTTALKGQTKTQGNWGEFILESILEKSGLK